MASTIPNLSFNPSSSTAQYNQMTTNPLNPYQTNSIFMQPIGNIYGLNNSSEIGNIPIGSGVSVGLCLSEGTMYLKSMQNNGPVLLGYKLSPLENIQNTSSGQPQDSIQRIEQMLRNYEERFANLEKKLSSQQNPIQSEKGGKTQWQI